VHPERALSRALVQHLTEEMPDIQFTLEATLERGEAVPAADVVWLCGYERGRQQQVRQLRLRHPEAVLVVTAKEPEELWSAEVLQAGADCALTWPLDYERLSLALHRRIVPRRA
jgi:DNA-binding response OmpR family regulator